MTSRRGVCTTCRPCILVMVLTLAVIVHGEFTVIPMVPENITLNEDVVFYCSHSDAAAYAWYTNGSLVGNNPPEDITPSFNTLTIIALPRNNNTVIECAAFILPQPPNGTVFEVRAPSVTLVIPDNCGSRMVSTAVRSFIEVPLSQNVAEGVEVRFRCRHRATNTLVWEVDGVLFNNASSPLNASTFAVPVDGGSARHVLLFDAKLSYHHTSIVCAAIFSNGCPQQKTMPALLLIQGPLRAISGVFRDNLANHVGVSYFWEPPSTLDLTGVEPDIVYCAEVYNITCGEENLISSDCEIMNPIYPASVGDGLDPSYVYEITVTPRSNIPGAANGSVFTKREKFMSVNVFPRPVMESLAGAVVEFAISINDTESERLVKARARSYSIEIVSTDDPQTSVSAEVIGEGGDRVSVLLNKRKRWTYTVFAYGCRLHPVSITNMISTFAVQNVSVTSTAPGKLKLTADFLTNTSAVGMLAIVYPTENDSDIHYIEARLPQTEIQLTRLSGSAYSTSIFTLEEDGLPFNQSAHYLGEISIRRGKESAQTDLKATVQYELEETSSCVNVICTFLDSSSTDCVAVVHQRTSHLSSSGLMNITSYKFPRSGATATGCIPQVDLLGHQIGVVGGKQLIRSPTDRSSSVCSTGCIIGSVIGSVGGCLVIIVLVVIVIGTILYYQRIYSKKREDLSVHAQCQEDEHVSYVQLQERLPKPNTVDTQRALSIPGDAVEVHTSEPAVETVEEIQDDSILQDPHVHVPDNQPAPFLGASKYDDNVDVHVHVPTSGPPQTLPSVDGGPEQTSSTAATGETPVVGTNDADPANSGEAESSIPSLPTDKEDTVNPKEGECQLNQHLLPKVISYQPTETIHTERTAVVAIGRPPSSFQPGLVTRDSTVASADCSKDQEAMLSLNAVCATTKDSPSKPFQQKSPRAQMDLPTSIVSRFKHFNAHDLSPQSVQSSINNFNKNEWFENEQPEADPNGSTNTEGSILSL